MNQTNKQHGGMDTKMKVGQEIYYTGDMANREGWGTITQVMPCKFDEFVYTYEMTDGRVFNLTPKIIGQKYEGHGGTRFVTLEAYKAWKQEAWAKFSKETA